MGFKTLTTQRNLAIMLISALFFSCQDPIGIVIDTPSTGGQITTIFTDTIKVAASTVQLDSTFTSGQGSIVVGHYKDPVFGEVTAKSFAQLTLPLLNTDAFTPLVFPAADLGLTVYDSIYVYIAHNAFIYGDTTKPFSLALHRLTDNFTNTKYTKDDVLGYEPTPLSTKEFTYKDLKRAASTSQDSLLIFKLPDVLGQELYNLVGTDTGTDITKFTAAVKGLAFIPSPNAENAFGLSISGSYVQLYYHTTNDLTTRKSIPLTFYSQRFSQIKNNRQGTALQNLKLLEAIPQSLTNGRTYIQTGLGVSTKLLFPSLEKLQNTPNITINRAELVIEPDLDQISANYQTPPQIAMVQLEKSNQIKKTTTGLIDFVALDALSGTQYISTYDATNNKYSFNFTSYLQDLISKKKSTDGIALVPSLLNTTTSTISIYNSNVSRMVIKNIKLNVYYSTKK